MAGLIARRQDALTVLPKVCRATIAGLALCLGVLAPIAYACQVCIPYPVKTLADRLIDADAVVAAREDPDRPFHFRVVEVLAGNPGPGPVDAFLNSRARRVLALFPERHMLLARDPRDGKWTTLGIADAEFDRVVRRILARAGEWRPMETNNPGRLAEFAQLLGHQDDRLHELAYLEVGRAPYASIRRISAEVSLDTVRAMLDDPRYLEWRSLAILMLAQSERAADRARIVATFEDKQRLGSTLNLAAWATAYVAIERAAGADRIRYWYLERRDRSGDELEAVVKALSVHGTDDPRLREPIAAAYRALLQVHPELAPGVARDLIAWRRWDFADQIRAIRTALAGTDPLAAYALDLYLHRAAVQHATGDTAAPGASADPNDDVSETLEHRAVVQTENDGVDGRQ